MLTHDEQGGGYVELHPIDTFLEVTDEPVAGDDDGVNLRHGALVTIKSSFGFFVFRAIWKIISCKGHSNFSHYFNHAYL